MSRWWNGVTSSSPWQIPVHFKELQMFAASIFRISTMGLRQERLLSDLSSADGPDIATLPRVLLDLGSVVSYMHLNASQIFKRQEHLPPECLAGFLQVPDKAGGSTHVRVWQSSELLKWICPPLDESILVKLWEIYGDESQKSMSEVSHI